MICKIAKIRLNVEFTRCKVQKCIPDGLGIYLNEIISLFAVGLCEIVEYNQNSEGCFLMLNWKIMMYYMSRWNITVRWSYLPGGSNGAGIFK